MSDEVQGQTHEDTVEDDFRKQFKDIELPSDFDTEVNFLAYATKLFDDDLSADKKNRDAAYADAKFMAGEQWDAAVSEKRKTAKKPTLTVNRLPAFVGTVLGNRRLTETNIKVLPDDAKHKEAAIIRSGLIRSIQKISRADTAYNKALENAVIGGIGSFGLSLKYAHDDVFEQDIVIEPTPNPFSVVWDAQSEEPTGSDARHMFKVEVMRRTEFAREYPNARAGDLSTNTSSLGLECSPDWVTQDTVRVVNFWRMRSHRRILALVKDKDKDDAQDVEDITDQELEEFQDRLVMDAEGLPIMREADRLYAQMYVITATDILEGPYNLQIQRVPEFRVPGWEVNIGDGITRFGLIRFMRDPQKLHNYWRSVIAEKLMGAPRSKWIASQEAVEGHEKEWRESHLSDDPLLVYNGESGQPPRREDPAPVEVGLIEAANSSTQDMQDVSNIHDASLGQTSNEVSGKAIIARQRVGELGTVIYQDNLDLAIEEAGRAINQLIPYVYDTARTIKVLGDDGQDLSPVLINDTTDKNSVDITTGKYSVTSTSGPSSVTKRVEAAEGMLNMVNAMPDTLAVVADLIVEAQDWPKSAEFARRLRIGLPPGLVSENDMTQEQQQAQAAAAEQAQIQAQREEVAFEVDMREKTARADQAQALAQQAQANAAKAFADIDIDTFKAIAEFESNEMRDLLSAIKAFQTVQNTAGTQDTGEFDNG